MVDNGYDCGSVESQSLKLSILTDVNDFLCQLFLQIVGMISDRLFKNINSDYLCAKKGTFSKHYEKNESPKQSENRHPGSLKPKY